MGNLARKITGRKKALLIFAIVILLIWVVFAAFVLSEPREWFKWGEWVKHIQENHQSK